MKDTHLINIDGHTMAATSYNQDKDSIPVIFIHGLTGAIDFWETVQIPYVNECCRWYSLSLPGHHPAAFASRFKSSEFNDDTIADLTYAAIQELVGDQKFVLIGISAGGYMALNVASKYPDATYALACIDGFAVGDWIRKSSPVRTRLVFPPLVKILHLILIRSEKVYLKECYNNIYSLENARQNISDVDCLILKNFSSYKNLSARDITYYARRLWTVDIRHRLSNITCPTLLIHGDQDAIVPYEQGKRVLEYLPDAEFVTLEGIGHVPMWEDPAAFEEVFVQWLKKVMP
jgi:pimeloyl-ACP methyl ester carboxylesterase